MEETKQQAPETREALLARREWLWTKTGQHQFTEAVVEAELIQFNQEILNINNKLQKLDQEPPPAPVVTKDSSPAEILSQAIEVEVSPSV